MTHKICSGKLDDGSDGSGGDGGGDFKGRKKKVQVMVTRSDFGGGVVVQRQIMAKAHDRGGFILAADSYTTNHLEWGWNGGGGRAPVSPWSQSGPLFTRMPGIVALRRTKHTSSAGVGGALLESPPSVSPPVIVGSVSDKISSPKSLFLRFEPMGRPGQPYLCCIPLARGIGNVSITVR